MEIPIYDDGYEPTRTPQPTSTEKGSVARVEVLRDRVANGEHLFHPDDSQAHCGRVTGSWIDKVKRVNIREERPIPMPTRLRKSAYFDDGGGAGNG